MGNTVTHGTKELIAEEFTKIASDIGLGKTKLPDFRAADDTLKEERQTYARTGEMLPGFADAMVPTLEEKVVIENQPPAERANGKPIGQSEEAKAQEADGTAPPQARTAGGEMHGAPADASQSAQVDDEPPHARSGKNDAEGEEREAPRARSILRRHLKAGPGQSPWALPTPTPVIDPNCFDDPICDEYWKGVWLAAAVHNVRSLEHCFALG
jgi:phospholipase D1/2